MDVGKIITLGLEHLWVNEMKNEPPMPESDAITHSLLHDLKNMVVDIQNLK